MADLLRKVILHLCVIYFNNVDHEDSFILPFERNIGIYVHGKCVFLHGGAGRDLHLELDISFQVLRQSFFPYVGGVQPRFPCRRYGGGFRNGKSPRASYDIVQIVAGIYDGKTEGGIPAGNTFQFTFELALGYFYFIDVFY